MPAIVNGRTMREVLREAETTWPHKRLEALGDSTSADPGPLSFSRAPPLAAYSFPDSHRPPFFCLIAMSHPMKQCPYPSVLDTKASAHSYFLFFSLF